MNFHFTCKNCSHSNESPISEGSNNTRHAETIDTYRQKLNKANAMIKLQDNYIEYLELRIKSLEKEKMFHQWSQCQNRAHLI